ncbi:acetylornithine deacetylase [Ramlibacter sp.]|uniref:acetylornithine deacetylase n=1 Tax=Ramlibacter sp. TaxID=1917967 RepID=UPI00185D5421|nr:acetylornithine deacetylase [Ramlibacter sp.]MBA2674639.1 acetylornithine deacetylase [Ramlibacter sp.]
MHSTSVSPPALELARAMVAVNTVSANSNLALIHMIRDELARFGVASRLTYNADKTKANLFATLGEGKPAGVILSGHTDTVPWDGQDWSTDPLAAQVKDGKLFGRGSADMKGFIAMAVAQAGRFLESDAPFAVHFAFSYDEEVGCFGVKELIADMREAGIAPLACIVGEPTSMVPAIAHKGVYRYRCCVRGKAAHSSLTPQSVNAIEMAARVVGRVRDMAEDFERSEPRYDGFDVPFSTSSVGQFHGGIADNVVPLDAEFHYEFRNLPTADAAAMQAQVVEYARSLEPAMQRVAPDAGFRFEPICEVPGFLGSADDGVTRLAQRLAGTRETTLVAFGTEAGLFHRAGIPTVVCGPGSIMQAHQPDEYVSLEQLARCESFLRDLAAVKEIG